MDDDKLNRNAFKIFMRFAEAHKDLHGDAIKYLKSINPEKITIVQAPLILSFKNNLDNKELFIVPIKEKIPSREIGILLNKNATPNFSTKELIKIITQNTTN